MLSSSILLAVNIALRSEHLLDPNLKSLNKNFFYRPFHRYFFPEYEYEGLLIASISALNFTRFLFIFSTAAFLFESNLFNIETIYHFGIFNLTTLIFVLTILGFILLSFLIVEYIPHIIGKKYSQFVLDHFLSISSIFMFLSFPFTYLICKLSFSKLPTISNEQELAKTKKEIIEIIQKSRESSALNINEKKLIESAIRFNDRIAREVMVPRVDVFSLSHDTPIREAVKLIEEEGYSRIPIYRNTVDNIVGVLMYKDLLQKFMEYVAGGNDPSILDAPIETIQKEILYTPETTKISNLLLEFKKKQLHLAIVVDEYGGTEGIVSIEDILEEIVGEIEDEYDEEEELFFPQPGGSFIVDARMGILDIEQELGIKIPQESDYDTIGGYVFHCTGTIPSKGFVIHREDFKIEILKSDEKSVKKVHIRPIVKDEVEDQEET